MKLKKLLSIAVLSSVTAVCAVSCSEDELPGFVHADKREVKLENTGLTSSGDQALVVLAANNDWHVSRKDEWLHISHESGARGRHNLFISADPNTSSKSRLGFIEIDMAGKTEQFAVTQNGFDYILEIDRTSIELDIDGAAAQPGSHIMTVTANSSWTINVPSDCGWLKVTPASGEAGETPVVFSADENTSGSDRMVSLAIIEGDMEKTFSVSQSGTRVMFDDKTVGFVYFTDDMAWATGGNDQVGSINGSANSTLPIYSAANVGIKTEFDKRYFDFNASGSSVYAADGYLKFGKGNNQNAFMLKEPLDIPADKKANVAISFRLAKNGTDKFTVSVAIDGPGEIENAVNDELSLSAPCVPVDNSDKTINWQWKDFTVNVNGVTAETKIIIGETQYIIDGFKTRSGYFRGFIDDIKVTRTANN